MKIWIALAETNDGNEMAYFYSEADAETYAHDFCKARWDNDNGPMPEHWRDAYELLTADPSYMDWLHMDDLSISDHPALKAVFESLSSFITLAGDAGMSNADFRKLVRACAKQSLEVLK